MGREARFRRDLSMPGMLAETRRCFERVADPVACRELKLSDCLMRERLDDLDPAELRRPFKRLFALAQRGGVLKDFEWLDGLQDQELPPHRHAPRSDRIELLGDDPRRRQRARIGMIVNAL